MDYRKCAQEIYDLVGKRDNLVSAAHCATRLRLVTNDNSKVDMKKLEDVDGVKGVFSSNGQLQIILGTGTVNKVYDEFLSISGMTAATKADVKAAAAAKQPLPFRMVKALGDVFVPILPAIVAAGLIMGLLEGMTKIWPEMASSGTYQILNILPKRREIHYETVFLHHHRSRRYPCASRRHSGQSSEALPEHL